MTKSKIRILFLDILSDDEELRRELERQVQNGIPYGIIYEEAFRPIPVHIVTINATKPSHGLRLKNYDAVLIGGSAHDPSQAGDEHPWMYGFKETIRNLYEWRVPMLGVCGGHEFIADALGG